jgi:hypothetical protein
MDTEQPGVPIFRQNDLQQEQQQQQQLLQQQQQLLQQQKEKALKALKDKQAQINKRRRDSIYKMLAMPSVTISRMDVNNSVYGLVYIITAPDAYEFTTPNQQGIPKVVKKFVCKLLFSRKISFPVNSVNYTKEATSDAMAQAEANSQSKIYLETVKTGRPICPDILTVLQFTKKKVLSVFLKDFMQQTDLFTEEMLKKITADDIVTAIFMECVDGYDPSTEIKSLKTIDSFIPTLTPEQTNDLYNLTIAQILITVFIDKGESYNLDNHQGNILVTKIKNIISRNIYFNGGGEKASNMVGGKRVETIDNIIYTTSLIDFGLFIEEKDIPSLLDDFQNRTNNHGTRLKMETLITQYISEIKEICDKIKKNVNQVSPEQVCNFLKSLLNLCQLFFEIKFNWNRSNIDWVLDYLCLYLNISRTPVRTIETELMIANMQFEFNKNQYLATKDSGKLRLGKEIRKKQVELMRRQREENKKDIETIKYIVPVPGAYNVFDKIAQDMNDIMKAQSAYYTDETVTKAIEDGQYYIGGVITMNEDLRSKADFAKEAAEDIKIKAAEDIKIKAAEDIKIKAAAAAKIQRQVVAKKTASNTKPSQIATQFSSVPVSSSSSSSSSSTVHHL